MNAFVLLAGIIILVLSGFAGFDTISLLALVFLGLYVLAKTLSLLNGFAKEFSHNEWQEVEKSSGTEPKGNDIKKAIEDAGKTLLNENKPKGRTTKRVAEGIEEFWETFSKFFRQ